MVPQDEVVHGQLTVNQALMYAAELRLPRTPPKEDRQQVVAQVLSGVEMTQHAETRGGQTPAVSASVRRWRWNCWTGPSLLISTSPPPAWTRRWTVR